MKLTRQSHFMVAVGDLSTGATGNLIQTSTNSWQPAHMPTRAPAASAVDQRFKELRSGSETDESGSGPNHRYIGFVRQLQHVHQRHQAL